MPPGDDDAVTKITVQRHSEERANEKFISRILDASTVLLQL